MTLFRRSAEQRYERQEHILIDRLADAAEGCSLESVEKGHLDICRECRDILAILVREFEEKLSRRRR